MTDSPPPYPWSDVQHRLTENHDKTANHDRYVGYIRLPSQPVQQLTFATELYKHRHEAYITTIFAQERHAESTADRTMTDRSLHALHILPSDSLRLDGTTGVFSCTGDLEPENLKMIRGFQDLGSFALPRGSKTGSNTTIEDDLQRVDAHLALQLRDTDPQQQKATPINLTDSASEHIRSSYFKILHQDVDASSGDLLAVHVYKIHIFSNSANGLSETTGGRTSLLFRWAKPRSVYGNLQGSWQSSLLDVIGDGVRNAGSELMILIRGAPDQEMREVQGFWQEGTIVLDV